MSRWWMKLAVAVSACALTGCVTIPVYDSKTDELLTNLQSDTDTFLVHLADAYDTTGGPGKACAYPANAKTYEQFRIDIGILRTRASALYDDQTTVATLDRLQDTYDKLENVHQAASVRADHCILPELLTTDQRAIDAAIGSLLKLELAKKGVS